MDIDQASVRALQAGRPLQSEPELDELLRRGLAHGRLHFSTDVAAAVRKVELVWVAYDTPVDQHDHPDTKYVVSRVTRLFPHLGAGTLVLMSSQVPVGTTRLRQTMTRAGLDEVRFRFDFEGTKVLFG